MIIRFALRARLLRHVLSGLLLAGALSLNPAFANDPRTEGLSEAWASDVVSMTLLEALEQTRTRNVGTAEATVHLPIRRDGERVMVELIFEEGAAGIFKNLSIPGVTVTYVSDEWHRAYAWIDRLDLVLDLARIKGIRNVRPEFGSLTNRGAVTSEAVKALNVERAVQRFNVAGRELDGRTQRIGVISDSFAITGGVRIAATTPPAGVAGTLRNARNQQSGDLPETVQILRDWAGQGATDEGAAMAELVHDLAPGAGIAFHTAVGGQAVFADGIRRLWQEAGSTIVVDDIIYFAEPMFQDGIIAQAARNAVQAGVPYFSAAGNNRNFGYQFQYRDANPDIDDQASIPSGNDLHLWDNGSRFLPVTVIPGDSVTIITQWNQPFASIPGSQGAQIDLDVYLYSEPDPLSDILFRSSNRQGTTGNPMGDAIEVIGFANFFNEAITVYMAIEHFQGNKDVIPQDNQTPLMIRTVFFGGLQRIGGITSDLSTYGGPTQYGHSMADGAVAVAAVPWFDTPNFRTDFPPTTEIDPQTFSSLGGNLTVYFDDAGNLAPRTTFEPQIAAVDGNNTTFFGTQLNLSGYNGEPDGFPNFFGTSAAAPNAAAVAALLKDMDPSLTPAEITSILQQTAIDVRGRRAAAGVDPVTGHGLIDANRAVEVVAARVGEQAIVSPTPTPPPIARRSFNFDTDSEGWIFQTVTPDFIAPEGTYQQGALTIRTSDNIRTFGLYSSPSFVAGAWGRLGDLPLQGGTGDSTLFRIVALVRSDLTPESITRVPVMRVRQGTENFEQSDVLVVTSTTSAGVSPANTNKSYRLYFQLPESQDRFRLFFDVLNTGGQDRADATFFVDRVLIDAISQSNLRGRRSEKTYDLRGNAMGWRVPSPPFGLKAPESAVTSGGLRLGPAIDGEGAYFSFWTSPDNFGDPAVAEQAVKMFSNRLYMAIARIRSSAPSMQEAAQLPTFRVRMNDRTLNYSAYTNIESVSAAARLPSGGQTQDYVLFFEGRPEIEGSELTFAFDYLLIPGSGNSPDHWVELETLWVESWDLPF